MGSSPPAAPPRPTNLVLFLRYGLPAILFVAGIVLGFAFGWDLTGVEACAAMWAAGASLFLMNLLMRMGISGDSDRDTEDEARAYFDRHGRWPGE
jgi:hypothetical protein